MAEKQHITILGVGNILLTDDGLGVQAIQELERTCAFPPNVILYDGGTGGLGLLPVIEQAERLIVVDAVLVEAAPGTVVRFDFEDLPATLTRRLSAHEIDIIEVLKVAESLGKRPPTVIIGMQPEDISTYGTELTVKTHLPKLVSAILEELESYGIKTVPAEPSH